MFQWETQSGLYWMYFSWAKFSCTLGENKETVALIAVIHHYRGICFIEKFGARATTVREEPQLIKDTIALSWKFYLWEHCCRTCHWLAVCHHNAVHFSVQVVYFPHVAHALNKSLTKQRVHDGNRSRDFRRDARESWLISHLLKQKELWLSPVSSGALFGKDTRREVSPV